MIRCCISCTCTRSCIRIPFQCCLPYQTAVRFDQGNDNDLSLRRPVVVGRGLVLVIVIAVFQCPRRFVDVNGPTRVFVQKPLALIVVSSVASTIVPNQTNFEVVSRNDAIDLFSPCDVRRREDVNRHLIEALFEFVDGPTVEFKIVSSRSFVASNGATERSLGNLAIVVAVAAMGYPGSYRRGGRNSTCRCRLCRAFGVVFLDNVIVIVIAVVIAVVLRQVVEFGIIG
mmetsp:Transcript_4890/g.10805  ORF Transcript_4890/g.10805 Transcript_4890/m.10805 type:complete len:228 (+) Transcript_4890:2351-3034(+)